MKRVRSQYPLKQIRRKCLDCSCDQYLEVRSCDIPECPLWPFRFGMRPRTVARYAGNEGQKLLSLRNYQVSGDPSMPRSPLTAIRHCCLGCCGDNTRFVRYCPETECPIWLFRFGMMPKSFSKKYGPYAEELFDPENFKEGGKYGPDVELESLEP